MRLWTVYLIASVAMFATLSSVHAQQPFPEFSAKRVKPPAAGTKKLITIQIDPTVAQRPSPAEPEAPAPLEEPLGRYEWFWNAVSPTAASSGPGRLDKALLAMAEVPGRLPAPRLQHLQDIAKVNGVDILRSTVGTNVSPALVLAVISVESSGRADAQSSAGAQGLMQLMPATAARFGVEDSFSPAANIAGGVAYLDWLMEAFDQDPILVLAGYNAGEGAVRRHDGVPPYAETRDYVPKVLAAFSVAKGLCRTPPQLISDGCVFAAMN
ncbi:MAG: lytic transglycosylase domain-containing protein [Pseudomonadota bacterium]